MKLSLLPALLAVLFLGSCAGSHYFIPAREQNANTGIMHYNGIPYIHSTLEHTEVSALVTSRGGRSLGIDLLCYNGGDETFEVDPGRISVTGFDAQGIPAPFRVFSAEQYIRRRNTRNAIIGGAVLVATVGAAIAASEGALAGGNNFDANLFLWSLSAVPPVFFNNPAMQPFVPDDGLARPHTLHAGAAYRGMVMVNGRIRSQERIQIAIPVNGMTHRFDFAGKARRY